MLELINDRWHLDGEPIGATCNWMHLLCPDGAELFVRVEHDGRNLVAHYDLHGLPFTYLIDTVLDNLRRPDAVCD
jgi:hypothetical protein